MSAFNQILSQIEACHTESLEELRSAKAQQLDALRRDQAACAARVEEAAARLQQLRDTLVTEQELTATTEQQLASLKQTLQTEAGLEAAAELVAAAQTEAAEIERLAKAAAASTEQQAEAEAKAEQQERDAKFLKFLAGFNKAQVAVALEVQRQNEERNALAKEAARQAKDAKELSKLEEEDALSAASTHDTEAYNNEQAWAAQAQHTKGPMTSYGKGWEQQEQWSGYDANMYEQPQFMQAEAAGYDYAAFSSGATGLFTPQIYEQMMAERHAQEQIALQEGGCVYYS